MSRGTAGRGSCRRPGAQSAHVGRPRASMSSLPSLRGVGVPLPSLQRLSRKGLRRLGAPLQRPRRNTPKLQANPISLDL